MTTIDLDLLKAEVARIERELEDVKAKIRSFAENGKPNGPGPFAQLRGILDDVHVSEREIRNAKIRARDA